jgi:hypothetical protein
VRVPPAPQLLQAWERGIDQPLYERAVILLAAALPESTLDDPAAWSLGKRDARLLTLRETLFGSQLVSVVDCPRCDTRLELNFTTADVRMPFAEQASLPIRVEASDGEYVIGLHAPNTFDLRLIASQPDREMLLNRCLSNVQRNSVPVPADQLPSEVIATIVRRFGEIDPQADVRLALRCFACGHEWLATYDIVSFLWLEIEAWAERMLREVHLLASAYGWSESDILAMDPRRRQRYLEMVVG